MGLEVAADSAAQFADATGDGMDGGGEFAVRSPSAVFGLAVCLGSVSVRPDGPVLAVRFSVSGALDLMRRCSVRSAIVAVPVCLCGCLEGRSEWEGMGWLPYCAQDRSSI